MSQNNKDNVTITREEFNNLSRRSNLLTYMEYLGLDNSGAQRIYHEAMELVAYDDD